MEKEKTLEAAFEELDALLGRMEDKDLPLEEAFKLYQEGTKLIAFCKGLQAGSPVDAFASPEPSPMPGYSDKVIMAAGAFTQGSSIELSADGPIEEPYAVYFQGGLTWYHAKFGIIMSLQKLFEENLVEL